MQDTELDEIREAMRVQRRKERMVVGAVLAVVGMFVFAAYMKHREWDGTTLVKVCEGGRLLEHRPSDNTYWVARHYQVKGKEFCDGK